MLATTIWWAAMLALQLVHALALLFAVRTPPRSQYERRMRLCATLYVIAAAYRSCFPVLWEAWPHGCLFAWPGGALVDQIFSQVGEVAFAVQVALATERALRLRGQPASAAVARYTYLVIAFVARPCCWAGCATDFKGFHVVEESCWAAFAAVNGALLAPHAAGDALVGVCVGVIAVYVAFMLAVDVPMYLQQWRDDAARGVEYASLVDGLVAMARCRNVVTDYDPWREAIVWQTGYFGVFPALSVALARTGLEPASKVT